jgi:hypothetical protein
MSREMTIHLPSLRRRQLRRNPTLMRNQATVARVAFIITNAQKAKLREKGYDDDQIAKTKPAEAHELLGLKELVIVDDEAPPHCRAHQKKGTR